MDQRIVDVSAPQFYDWWQRVVARGGWDPVDAAALRAASRMFRAVVDAHACLDLDMRKPSHASAHARSLRDPAFARRLHVRSATRWPHAFPFRPTGPLLRATALRFGHAYNRPLDAATLPRGLLELTFGARFDRPLRTLDCPPSLTLLAFGRDFAKPLDARDLPRCLRVLRLGESYVDELVAADLPSALVELDLGRSFDRPIAVRELPRGLRALRFGHRFREVVHRRDLPPALVELALGNAQTGDDDDAPFPAGLTTLRACRDVPSEAIPAGLRDLRLGGSWDDAWMRAFVRLPLQRLRLGDSFRGALFPLPETLVSLRVGDGFDLPIELSNLRSLTSLTIGHGYDRELDPFTLPPALNELVIGDSFDRPVDASRLPRSLTWLQLGDRFDHSIDTAELPAGMRVLILGDSFNQPFDDSRLPRSLLALWFGSAFSRDLREHLLPPSLTKLVVAHHYCGLVGKRKLIAAFRPRKRTQKWFLSPGGGERQMFHWS